MKTLTGMTGVRKAAILAMSLGEEGARQILNCLNETEVERLAREIALLDTIAPDDHERVLTEFHQAMAAGVATQGGNEAVRRLLDQSLPPEAAQAMYDRVTKSVKTTAGFTALTQSDPQQLVKFVLSEQPQTIALIMAHLDGATAAQLVTLLPEQLRADVIARMASLDETSPEVAYQISSVIEQRLRAISGTSHEAYGGVRAVAELLNRLDRTMSQAVLEAVETQSGDLAGAIRNLMFVFDDLVHVEDAGFRELVQQADRKTLTVALKGASESIREKFFKNMSKRAAGVLQEEMEMLGAVKLREVEAAQQEIVAIARKLEEEGLLSTGAAAGEAYVV